MHFQDRHILLLAVAIILRLGYLPLLFCLKLLPITRSRLGRRPKKTRNMMNHSSPQGCGASVDIQSTVVFNYIIIPNDIDNQFTSYVGEVGIWTGIWALSSASLQSSFYPKGTIALAAISPLFTWFLLRNVRYR